MAVRLYDGKLWATDDESTTPHGPLVKKRDENRQGHRGRDELTLWRGSVPRNSLRSALGSPWRLAFSFSLFKL